LGGGGGGVSSRHPEAGVPHCHTCVGSIAVAEPSSRAQVLTMDASRKWVLMFTASRVFSPSPLRTVSDREKGRILVPVRSGSSAASPCGQGQIAAKTPDFNYPRYPAHDK
jgi:hypothetical protein